MQYYVRPVVVGECMHDWLSARQGLLLQCGVNASVFWKRLE